MAAARFGHYTVVRELLLSGADASVTTSFGETALSLALHLRHGAVAELLQGCCPGRPLVAGVTYPEAELFQGPVGEVPQGAERFTGVEWSESLRRHYMNIPGRCEAHRGFEAELGF